MIRIRQGIVVEVLSSRPGYTEVFTEISGVRQKAVNYDFLTGTVKKGDRVILNTTAVHKNLGTGGTHFIMANIDNSEINARLPGHIMKMRYAPAQVKVLAVEEAESPHAEIINNTKSLEQTPVIVGTLHSMLPVAASVCCHETGGNANIVFIMTDGAALPMPLSQTVHELKQKNILSATVTYGHAFGGDYEAVNIYTALLAAKAVARADIIIVAMGPGIVGTGSEFGFTGVEQGEIINAVNILGGSPIAIPRISFADARERHRGISHHTCTSLGKIALTPCLVALPDLEQRLNDMLEKQLLLSGIRKKHVIKYYNSSHTGEVLQKYGLRVKTMGRGFSEDPAFFMACGAAAMAAVETCKKG
ncbi:conserved hypothetical protein [Desulfofarcimen acetoxidans DSM 771]|uniref:DUF3866 domain-containing protein n=1 Tax=Desulfofarcimen acetoxidans (strain ATCC 49208 / DSM 771 / KCTC 5769 / VKM B-1644 / 5575) TaxID=485916 RepID=C8VYW6_DESAS|nr:DUF3866 family protein [Desulfofarcimen acetoxidans]ACV62876.1 conserved hypothetical protein [Desulfofarcimen acetoxidans DSM 771]